MLSTDDLKGLFADSTPERAIARARKLSAKGKLDQAIQVLGSAAERLGQAPEIRLEMATLHLSGGKPREACNDLKDLMKADPASVNRVSEFVDWARANDLAIDALYETLAEGLIARRNYGGALEVLERIDRAALARLMEGRLANLNRFLEKGSKVPRSALPTLWLSAIISEAIGEWQKALDCYRKILTAAPTEFASVDERIKGLVGRNYKLTPLRLAYAELLEELGHHDRSREEYFRALEIDARCAQSMISVVEKRLEEAPDDKNHMWDLARVRLATGDMDGVLAIAGKLVDAGSHLDEIEKLIDELSSSGKESVETHLLLAKVCMARDNASRAVQAVVSALASDAGERGMKALEELIERFPQELRPYQILADTHLKEGRIDRCLEIYASLRESIPASAGTIVSKLQAVLMADPGNAKAIQMLEELSIEARDVRSGIPFLRRRLRRGPIEARGVMESLTPMLASCPDDAAARMAAAEATFAMGDPSKAWEYLEGLIDPSHPPEAALLHLIVMCGGSSRDMWDAVSSFIGERSQWKDLPEVTFALAEAAGRAGVVPEALEGFRNVAEKCPDSASVCHAAVRGLWKRLKSGVGAGPHDGSLVGEQVCAFLAEALVLAGDYTAAVETLRAAESLPSRSAGRLVDLFTEAIKRQTGNLTLRAGLAEVYLASGQLPHAMEIARKGLVGRDDPESAQLMMTYGDGLVRGGKLDEATRAYASVVKRDPGLVGEATTRLQKLIELDVSRESAHLTMGRMMILAGRVREGVNELLTAWSIKAELGPAILKDLERTARKNPGEPSIDFARAQVLIGQGEIAQAVGSLGSQIGRDPELTAEILARLEGIAASHPTCSQAHLELGRAYALKGWVARACECLLRANSLDGSLSESIATLLGELRKDFPQDPEPHIAAARIHESTGRLLPAAEAYFQAIKMGGSPERALEGLERICSGDGPVPGRVHMVRARACGSVDAVGDAVRACRNALDASPDLASEAQAFLDTIIGSHPGEAGARIGRAFVRIRNQEIETACEDLAEALRLDRECAAEAADLAGSILDRRPSDGRVIRLRAAALRRCGDLAGSMRCLDNALATRDGRNDLDLILFRRTLALRDRDRETARSLLQRAGEITDDRDHLLWMLHREALDDREAEAGDDGVETSIADGAWFLAAERLREVSTRKAWLLEKAGRHAEAAAVLQKLMDKNGAAERFVALHDRFVSRALAGDGEALMAEAVLRFEKERSAAEKPGALQGGAAAEVAEGGQT